MKRILAIDYGSKRIGVAVSDPMQVIATALNFIPNEKNALNNILNLVKTYDVGIILVGLPLNLKGEHGKKSEEILEFVKNLKKETDLPIIEWDERFTTKIAHRTMIEMGLKKKQRQDKTKIDSMAASILLQSYLDSIRKKENEN